MTETVRVAQHLTEISRLYGELLTTAVHNANAKTDGTSLPGGAAMVALAPVANFEAWANQQQADERYGRAYTSVEDEDPDDAWSPFQTLAFWSEAWRRERGMEFEPSPYRPRPTVETEVNYIRWALDWAWDNEPGWDDFATDMRTVVAKLENILTEGNRTERGVPCLSCGVDLERPSKPRRKVHECEGHGPYSRCRYPRGGCCDRGGRVDEWNCPGCERRYDDESYRRAVSQSAFANAEWLTIEQAVDRTGEKAGTIKVWAHREKVRKRRDPDTGRVVYHAGDIEARANEEVAV